MYVLSQCCGGGDFGGGWGGGVVTHVKLRISPGKSSISNTSFFDHSAYFLSTNMDFLFLHQFKVEFS